MSDTIERYTVKDLREALVDMPDDKVCMIVYSRDGKEFYHEYLTHVFVWPTDDKHVCLEADADGDLPLQAKPKGRRNRLIGRFFNGRRI